MGARVASLATASLVALMCGCGSSGSSKSIPKSEYISRANAVCSSLQTALRSIGGNTQAFRPKVVEAIRAREHANAQLRAIPLPASKTIILEWLQERERIPVATKKANAAKPRSTANEIANAEEAAALDKARALALSYGLTSCYSLNQE
jgi:hypothetical protein